MDDRAAGRATDTMAQPRFQAWLDADPAHRRAWVEMVSERRPKPDVRNLFDEQAHAPLPLRAGHARMPPGPKNLATEFIEKEVPTPHLPAFTEGRAFLAILEQLRNRRLLRPIHIRYPQRRAVKNVHDNALCRSIHDAAIKKAGGRYGKLLADDYCNGRNLHHVTERCGFHCSIEEKVSIAMQRTFDREILFPQDPYEAAFVFFAVIAFPEEGAGETGKPGSDFANALVKFSLWACSQAKGLRYIRDEKNNPRYCAPRKREFQGCFEHGMRRIDRRIAAYEIYGTTLFHSFFAAREMGRRAIAQGRQKQAFHMHPSGGPSPLRAEVWKASAVSPQQILRDNQEHWSTKLQLNRTGRPADPGQKVKDDYDRAFLPAVPVLHMVHALDACMRRFGPNIEGWADREPLTAMLLNAEFWIEEALEIAENWRKGPHIPGKVTLMEGDMIAIIR